MVGQVLRNSTRARQKSRSTLGPHSGKNAEDVRASRAPDSARTTVRSSPSPSAEARLLGRAPWSTKNGTLSRSSRSRFPDPRVSSRRHPVNRRRHDPSAVEALDFPSGGYIKDGAGLRDDRGARGGAAAPPADACHPRTLVARAHHLLDRRLRRPRARRLRRRRPARHRRVGHGRVLQTQRGRRAAVHVLAGDERFDPRPGRRAGSRRPHRLRRQRVLLLEARQPHPFSALGADSAGPRSEWLKGSSCSPQTTASAHPSGEPAPFGAGQKILMVGNSTFQQVTALLAQYVTQ